MRFGIKTHIAATLAATSLATAWIWGVPVPAQAGSVTTTTTVTTMHDGDDGYAYPPPVREPGRLRPRRVDLPPRGLAVPDEGVDDAGGCVTRRTTEFDEDTGSSVSTSRTECD